jgi:hypothetical protein
MLSWGQIPVRGKQGEDAMTFRSRLVAAGCGVACVSVLTAAAFAMAAPAPSPAQTPAKAIGTGKVCFQTRDVDGVSVSSPIGPKKLDGVYLRMNNHDVYQLSLSTICSQLQNSVRLEIQTLNATGTICQATDARVVARDPTSGLRSECWGSELHKLTPDEVAAIPTRERP